MANVTFPIKLSPLLWLTLQYILYVKKIGVVDCDEEIRKLEYFHKCDINTFYRDVKISYMKNCKKYQNSSQN